MNNEVDMSRRKLVRGLLHQGLYDEARDFVTAHPHTNWQGTTFEYDSEFIHTIRDVIRCNASTVLAALLEIPNFTYFVIAAGRMALSKDRLDCFILLIRDHRYDPSTSALFHHALVRANVQSLYWLVAIHGLDLDFTAQDVVPRKNMGEPLEMIQSVIKNIRKRYPQNHTNEVYYPLRNLGLFMLCRLENLVKVCLVDRWRGRHRCRVYLGIVNESAADLYALVIFWCDGLLKSPLVNRNPAVVRFFAIAGRLPIELQMILCRRVYGSPKDFINVKDRETAFIELADAL